MTRNGRRVRVEGLPARALRTQDLARDCSDDAATLVYDLPAQELEDLPLFIAASAIEPPLRARARILRVSSAQIVMTVTAALIGAMAGAWSIQQQALVTALPAEALVTALGKLWSVDRGARAAAARPQASAPTRTTPEASPSPGAPPEPPSPTAASAAAAAHAAPSEPQPAKARTAVAHDRRKHRTAARSRSSQSAQSRSEAAPSEPASGATPSAALPAGPRMGLLRINSRPWSKVFVDGRPVGSTPQTAIELPPGRHRIALISEDFELKRTLSVEVRAGQTVTRSVELLQ